MRTSNTHSTSTFTHSNIVPTLLEHIPQLQHSHAIPLYQHCQNTFIQLQHYTQQHCINIVETQGCRGRALEGQRSPLLIALHLLSKVISCDHNMVLGGRVASQQLGSDVLQHARLYICVYTYRYRYIYIICIYIYHISCVSFVSYIYHDHMYAYMYTYVRMIICIICIYTVPHEACSRRHCKVSHVQGRGCMEVVFVKTFRPL